MKATMARLWRYVRSLLHGRGSCLIQDEALIREFVAQPDNTFLVSFPRTGSHWLRMVMELYFGRPILVRAFYYPRRTDFLALHTHDTDLSVTRSHVIYLHREPIDTVYSVMQYHGEDLSDDQRVAYWSEQYGLHLNKWLVCESFTTNKTVVQYDMFRKDIQLEFAKICKHYGAVLDATRLQWAAARVSKTHVKNRTRHDPQVVNLDPKYAQSRARFRAVYSDLVRGSVLDGRQHLRRYL